MLRYCLQWQRSATERRSCMYRKCATEISALHQRQVTGSLLELMQKMPYEDITVTQLCQTAGVTRRVFYHLFSSKAGALHALIDHMILDIETYGKDISNEFLRFFCYWKDNRHLLDVLQDNQMTSLLLNRMIGITMAEDYDTRRRMNTYDRELGQNILVFNFCGVMGITINWYLSGFQKSPEEMVDLLMLLMKEPPLETE